MMSDIGFKPKQLSTMVHTFVHQWNSQRQSCHYKTISLCSICINVTFISCPHKNRILHGRNFFRMTKFKTQKLLWTKYFNCLWGCGSFYSQEFSAIEIWGFLGLQVYTFYLSFFSGMKILVSNLSPCQKMTTGHCEYGKSPSIEAEFTLRNPMNGSEGTQKCIWNSSANLFWYFFWKRLCVLNK